MEQMGHLLVSDSQLSELSLEEIQAKISELNTKIAFAYQTGNQALIHQLDLVLNSYNTAYNDKMRAMMPKDGNSHEDKINIS